ncbi:TIGR04076 family protein [Methanobrevibacter sp. DSM 116169]|uniref:TIGR04076 family protein n=1 Tax=Methanobrevibacter sp. DSM 116169 TaxID=3242727 RepID=UPI0038FC33C5
MNQKQLHKVKITVLKTNFFEDISKEYGVDGLSSCPINKEGDVFCVDLTKPERFCNGAWEVLYPYVLKLASDGENASFFNGNWINKPGIAIVSCGDGLRPVIFKLEATDIPFNLKYPK